MGTTDKKYTKAWGRRTYTTTKFPADQAINLYAQVAPLLGPKLMSLIMVPVASAIEALRTAKPGEGDDPPEIDLSGLAVSVMEVMVSLEEPQVLGPLVSDFLERAADLPKERGGLAGLLKYVFHYTTCYPITIAEGMEGGDQSKGGESIVTHYNTHFGPSMQSVREQIEVAIWILRLNLGKA